MSNEEMIERIREYLRYYPEMHVILDFFSIYGVMTIEILEKNEVVYSNHGTTLEKRFQSVLEYFGL